MTKIAARRTLLTGAALAVFGILIAGCTAQGSISQASGSASGSASAQATATASPSVSHADRATTPAGSAPTAPGASTGQSTSSAPASATSFSRVPWQKMLPQGAFFSPSRNISCEISDGGAGQDKVSCEAGSSNLSVSMDASGNYTSCSLLQMQCAGWNPEGIPTLAYGTETGVGPFLCESATSGITCTVTNGKGFQISRSGVTP